MASDAVDAVRSASPEGVSNFKNKSIEFLEKKDFPFLNLKRSL